MSKSLFDEVKRVADQLFEQWCLAHNERSCNLPKRGCLYGALVVLSHLEERTWDYSDLSQANTTDPGKFFGHRSILGHTNTRIAKVLQNHGHADLVPQATHGEMGRTSTGTKVAGLEFIKLVRSALNVISDEAEKEEQGDNLVAFLYARVFHLLTLYRELGGIDIPFVASESIATFISQLLDAHQTNPGAVLQHLVGAKLEIRFANQPLEINHNSSSSADVQTGRRGDFEVGSTVIHITKSASLDHYRKAWRNAESGRKVYLLVPNRILMGTTQLAEEYQTGFCKRVDVFSIEQFVAQNLDELALYDRTEALHQLNRLLSQYNELVDSYENDASLKVIVPDFGIE